MDIIEQFGKSFVKVWERFGRAEKLTEDQATLFARYMIMMRQANEQMNLTAITQPRAIVASHFQDSLILGKYVDLGKINSICDVGSGGGFPGIPLKIAFPHLHVVLIEVNKKKIRFLQSIIQELGLTACEVCPLDWRTFLRNTEYDIDLFCARASLQPEELIRMFKPSCSYKDKQLVYWASELWEPSKKVQPFIQREEKYSVNKSKQRKLVFMGL